MLFEKPKMKMLLGMWKAASTSFQLVGLAFGKTSFRVEVLITLSDDYADALNSK